MSAGPVVLFVCTQNAGRSQMAEALLARAAGGRVRPRSAGTQPASTLHPVVVEALHEIGLDTSELRPKSVTPELSHGVDVVVTMGCGDACPVISGARVIDWQIPDPAGLPLDDVRRIRDSIDERVRTLLDELLAGGGSASAAD